MNRAIRFNLIIERLLISTPKSLKNLYPNRRFNLIIERLLISTNITL